MHFEQYAKILGDTLFEAKVKAEKTYGKDNFTVITSKKIKHPIYLGLGYKEMFELTIGIKGKKAVVTEVPLRPSPSIEISTARTADFNSLQSQERVVAVKSITEESPQIRPAKATLQGLRAYNNSSKPTSMRNVHGLRSNQEGTADPKPQKLLNDQCIASEQIDEILSEILAVKETRKRQEKISGNLKCPASATTDNFVKPTMPIEPSFSDDSRLSAYEQRLNEMFEILRNLNQRVGNSIQKEIPDLPEGLFQVKKNLLEIETPLEVADQLIFELKQELPQYALQRQDQALQHTSRWLEKTIRFSPDPEFQNPQGPKVIALIGPTGVGKTTTIAKIAASYGLNFKKKLSIALFTLDTYRIGAADQLQQYAQIIDVDMEIIYSPEDIDAAIDRHADKDLIIIDTAGRCQKDSIEIRELRNFLHRLPRNDKYLVLSATAKYTDMLETVHCFDKVGFEHLIFTKTDETNTFGPLLAILVKTGKSLAYITNGQKVPDDFRKASFQFFNGRLFPQTGPKEGIFSDMPDSDLF